MPAKFLQLKVYTQIELYITALLRNIIHHLKEHLKVWRLNNRMIPRTRRWGLAALYLLNYKTDNKIIILKLNLILN